MENWPSEVEGAIGDLVQESAKSALKARIVWLDTARRQIEAAAKIEPTKA